MSKIIAVTNQKGGTGKTTTTMQLASSFSIYGYKVLVVDADPQGTASRWAATASDTSPFRAAVINLSHAKEKIHREIKNFINDYDIIFIDCPPAADSIVSQSAVCIADIAIIPVLTSPPDIWASLAIKDIINRAEVINENIKPYILINQYKPKLAITKEIEILLQKFNFPIFKTRLGDRTAYKESGALGGSVFDLSAKQTIARDEVDSLTKEIQNILSIKPINMVI